MCQCSERPRIVELSELAQAVCAFMHSHSQPAALGLAGSSRFEGARRLLDVGGGSGCFSIALAQQWPQLRCSILELRAARSSVTQHRHRFSY